MNNVRVLIRLRSKCKISTEEKMQRKVCIRVVFVLTSDQVKRIAARDEASPHHLLFSPLFLFFSLTGEKIYVFFFASSVRTNNWQSGKILIDEAVSWRRGVAIRWSTAKNRDLMSLLLLLFLFRHLCSWPPPPPWIRRRSIENALNTKRTTTLFF